MAKDCTHDCESCAQSCEERLGPPEKQNPLGSVGKAVGVISGKGGVGKTLVTAMTAVELRRRGLSVGILDADITGPSIPRVFGVRQKAEGSPEGIYPVKTKTGIELMSINLLLEEETAPVIWRGPIIAGAVKQFWTDVVWGAPDVLMVDLPPGTGDVPLTVFQSIPLCGVLVVFSPQELVSMIVKKAVEMARMMNVPILGLIENMSCLKCPDCGKKINLFGESHIDEIAEQYGLPVLARIPVDPELAAQCDRGLIELFENDYLSRAADEVEALPARE